MISTLADVELEREFLTSRLISEIPLSPDYLKLHLLLANLPILDSSEFMPILYSELINLCLNKLGLLKLDVVNDFYYGKQPILVDLLIKLKADIELLIPLYEEKTKEITDNVIAKVINSPKQGGYYGTLELIQSFDLDAQIQKNYEEMKISLMKTSASIDHLLSYYGLGRKVPSLKAKKVEFNTNYQIFLQQLVMNIEAYVPDAAMVSVVVTTIDSILAVNPKTSLDPFQKHLEDNLLLVLAKPEDFYKMCSIGQIISPIVGELFYRCYPHFYKKFFSIFLDEIDTLPYPKQIQVRRGFGVPSNDMSLIQLCASTMAAQPLGA